MNIKFCYKLIKKLPVKFQKRLHSNFQKYQKSTTSSLNRPKTISTVSCLIIKVLCYQAFVDVLRPKQTQHKRLIGLLVNDLKATSKSIVGTGGIDFNEIREHSQYFKMIKS